jgi:hypothetical protein
MPKRRVLLRLVFANAIGTLVHAMRTGSDSAIYMSLTAAVGGCNIYFIPLT